MYGRECRNITIQCSSGHRLLRGCPKSSDIFGNGALKNGKTSGSYRRFKPYEDRSNLLREITSDGEVIEELQSIIESGIPGSNDLPVAL